MHNNVHTGNAKPNKQQEFQACRMGQGGVGLVRVPSPVQCIQGFSQERGRTRWDSYRAMKDGAGRQNWGDTDSWSTPLWRRAVLLGMALALGAMLSIKPKAADACAHV